MFPCVYFFFPETRLRSLEEMDDIFKKSTNVFNVVSISVKEPYRYDDKGNLKQEYLEEVLQVQHDENSGVLSSSGGEKGSDSDRPANELKA